MFDRELGQKFVKENYYNKDTRKVLRYTFDEILKLEEENGTNLFNFSYEQLGDALRAFHCATRNALAKELNYMKQYEKWAVSKGMCQQNWSGIQNIERNELNKYLDLNILVNQYIKDRKELYELCDLLVNAQDAALLIEAYEGLYGNEMSEIRYLRKDGDINFSDNIIHVRGDKNRFLDNIDDNSLNILKEAIEQKDYLINNGETNARAPKRYLIDSQYIIRPTKNNKQGLGDETLSVNSINTKLTKIRMWIEKPHITLISVHRSGMFEKLDSIKNTIGDIAIQDYKDVLERFGEDPNTYNMLRENYEDYKWALNIIKEQS
jgi:hypothetical protein